jgi:hypothetical protein
LTTRVMVTDGRGMYALEFTDGLLTNFYPAE